MTVDAANVVVMTNEGIASLSNPSPFDNMRIKCASSR